jgi:L-amino acid N-acyltransferase YncA
MNKVEKNKRIKIRNAEESDLRDITRIYNYAILNTTTTFDTRPKTVKSQEKWFRHHSEKYPVIVAEDKSGIVGWASLSQWSDRCAYDNTAEISVYVDENKQGKGIGNKLIGRIIRLAKKNKLHVIIARIAGENEISVHLHKKYGFTYAGSLKEVGFKFNRYIDVHLMQLILK